ncbi:MAG: glutamate 5-kinase [Alcanivorax sp.]
MNEGTSQLVLENAKIVVIKIGSVLIMGDEIDSVNQSWMDAFATDVHALMQAGKKVVVVSSGSVALGRKALGIPQDRPPKDIPLAQKQAASAVGQFHVFNGYQKAFSKFNIDAAQVLLTMSETENRRMNLNARETIRTLLDAGIVPIINENDTVSTGEIRFGDNDRLSVRVAQMIFADTVVLLSTAHGLFSDNPDTNPQAVHIPVVDEIGDEHITMAGDAIPGLSTGGMKSKIEAALSAVKAGIDLIITNGQDDHALEVLRSDTETLSTLFMAQECDNNARKIWLGAHMNPKGQITVDDGALVALNDGKSLLPVGVKFIEGKFDRGDVVEILNSTGHKIGMGVSAYNVHDAKKIIGQNSKDIPEILGYIGRNELIHRNDMVLD